MAKSVFNNAEVELREKMQAAGETPELITEAVDALRRFERLHAIGNYTSPANMAAAVRLALAQRDQRTEVTAASLALEHGTHPPAVSRLARVIDDTVGVTPLSVPEEIFPSFGPLKGVPDGAGNFLVQPPDTREAAYAYVRLVEHAREEAQVENPLHTRGSPVADPENVVYLFRVKLAWKPTVWRDLELRGDQTLLDLHNAIQGAFNWDDDHLWAFYMDPDKKYRSRDLGATYGFGEDDMPAETPLGAFNFRARRKFQYLFDFGASLLHDIEVRSVGKRAARVKYPRIVEKHGRAPEQYSSDW